MWSNVENVPEYAKDYKCIVARYDEESKKYWFFGAWNSIEEAGRCADSVDGIVICISEDMNHEDYIKKDCNTEF